MIYKRAFIQGAGTAPLVWGKKMVSNFRFHHVRIKNSFALCVPPNEKLNTTYTLDRGARCTCMTIIITINICFAFWKFVDCLSSLSISIFFLYFPKNKCFFPSFPFVDDRNSVRLPWVMYLLLVIAGAPCTRTLTLQRAEMRLRCHTWPTHVNIIATIIGLAIWNAMMETMIEEVHGPLCACRQKM